MAKLAVKNKIFIRLFFVVLAALSNSGTSLARDKYPARAVEFIVPFGPGGGADQLARKSGKLLENFLKVPIPVINVPGATGGTGITKLLIAQADGYSMAVYIADTQALLVSSDSNWSIIRSLDDITPVARMMSQPSFLFVKQDSRFKTWADFEKDAKAHIGGLRVATVGLGSVDDMTLTYLESKDIYVTQVPYPKPSERYVSVLEGHVDALYEQAGDVAAFLENKQIRPIIVFGNKRFPAFKNVPSSKELGYDIGLPQFRAVVVKAGTDPRIIRILSDAFKKVAATAEYKVFLKEQYASEDSHLDAYQTNLFLRGELETMKKLWAKKKQ
ncbi:MAG TPA: tripartite tricarboxylate transporter substrate binding protein [Acidiferrobacterales bacterium]|nr:tripartite tricarboxylate transporter substrate binding protein [Acidiferrobacterales bacterium]